jgi:glycosyltransferase involved in cell wall biosynthesis
LIQEDELISVILPAHNAERFIGAALASVLAQTHRQIEVVVVDDGSTDRTAEMVAAVARVDSRVRLLRATNSGVSAARNLAIAEAKGRVVATIDADDLWHPDKLSLQLARLREASPRVGLVYCWSSGIDENGMVIAPDWTRSQAAGYILPLIISYSFIGNGSVPLMRRDCLEAAGGYDPELRFGEDWKLYIAMAEACEFAVVPAYLTGYRLHGNNASFDIETMQASVARVTEWIHNRWPNLPAYVLQHRAYNINGYFAFLAIRRGNFLRAVCFRLRALAALPSHFFSRVWIDFWAMWIGHLIGIRRYSWQRWSKPRPFLDPPTSGAT